MTNDNIIAQDDSINVQDNSVNAHDDSKIVKSYYRKVFDDLFVDQARDELIGFYTDIFQANLDGFVFDLIKPQPHHNPPIMDRTFLNGEDIAFGNDADFERYQNDLLRIINSHGYRFDTLDNGLKSINNEQTTHRVFDRWKQEHQHQQDSESFLKDALKNMDISAALKVIRFIGADFKAQLRNECNLNENEYENCRNLASEIIKYRNTCVGHQSQNSVVGKNKINDVLVHMESLLSSLHSRNNSERFSTIIANIQKDIAVINLNPIAFPALAQKIPDFDPELLKNHLFEEHTDFEKKYIYFMPEDEVINSYQQIVKNNEDSQRLAKTQDELVAKNQQLKKTQDELVAKNQQLKKAQDELVAKDQQLKKAEEARFVAEEKQKQLFNGVQGVLYNIRFPNNQGSLDNVSGRVQDVENATRVPLREMQRYRIGDLDLTKKQVSELLKNSILFADITFWTQGKALEKFPYYLERNKLDIKIIADWATRTELYRIETDKNHPDHEKAKIGRNVMRTLHDKGMITYGPVQKNFFSSQDNIIDIASRNKDRRFVVFTQDQKSTEEFARSGLTNILPVMFFIDNIMIHSEAANLVSAFSSAKYGMDELYSDTEAELLENSGEHYALQMEPLVGVSDTNSVTHTNEPQPQDSLYTEESNTVSDVPISYPLKAETGEKILIENLPSEGAILYTDISKSTDIQIRSPLGVGGEGTIYTTNIPGIVAKIYHKETLTKNRRDKIIEMIEADIHIAELCWPTNALYTEDGTFVGYTMPAVPDHYQSLNESVLQLNKETVREQDSFRCWNRLALVRLCKVLCTIFKEMHKHGILMGDVNANNIMVDINSAESPEVKFVDCDSYQFRGYPCPVGMMVYTSPEIYKRLGTDNPHFGSFLRIEEDELYAIASLLFRILMLNASAFEGKGTQNIIEAIRNYNFVYRTQRYGSEDTSDTQGNSGEDTPDGPNRMIWNNTYKKVKDNFETVFTGKGLVKLRRWIEAFDKYDSLIQNGIFTSELVPNRYYVPEGTHDMVDIVCDSCGETSNMRKSSLDRRRERNMAVLCPRCTQKLFSLKYLEISDVNDQKFPRDYICECCGKQAKAENYFEAVNRNNGVKGYEYAPICSSCRTTPATLTCTKCGKEYSSSIGRRFYNEKFHMRSLCEECRPTRR